MKQRTRRLGSAAALVLGCLTAWPGWAAPAQPGWGGSGRVVVLQSTAARPGARRCLTRIRQELAAEGFEVVVSDPGPRSDPQSTAEAMTRQTDAVAVIALVGDPEGGSAVIWIVDHIAGPPEVRKIVSSEDPAHAPEVLAIRTIEVLRASALKRLVESTRPPVAPVPAPSGTPPPAAIAPRPPGGPPRPVAIASGPATGPAPRLAPLGLEAGVSMLDSFRGLGPATLPVIRTRLAFDGPEFLRVTFAGLGTRPRIETTMGSVTIGQALGLVEIGAALRPGARLRPIVTLGAGALYLESDGSGIWPYQGVRGAQWAAVTDLGIGALFGIGGQLALALELHALVAFPRPVVRFVEADVAIVGRPTLIAALTLVAWR